MIQNNIPKLTNLDSSEEVKNFFDRYYQKEVTFPVQQIDAVVGYFLKRGFEEISAKSISILLLNQSRVDNVNVFQLVDTLKGLTDVQLSAVVTEILNTYRERTSTLGFKKQVEELTTESRNIRV
jgi:S-adenosylmethionine:diacylglycerol 3-amino-3-carboxypropyl transferase